MNSEPTAYPIIFTHVPRSAGTTLVHIMGRQYRRDEQFFFYVREKSGNIDEAMAEFKSLPEEKRKKLKLLQGHTSYGIHKFFDAYTYITLLRDPVDRIVSYYYYVLKLTGHYLHDLVVNNKMSLESFAASGLSTELDNIQTRQLSGIAGVPYGACKPAMLDTAKLNMVRQYAVCGITERFDETVMLMKEHFGWKYPFYVRLNTIKDRPLRSSLPAATVRLIEQTNALDMELYRFGVKEFEATVERRGESFRRELERFRQRNALLQRASRPSTGNLGFALWNLYLRLNRR